MYVAVLIASPKLRNLEASLVDAVRNAWGGGDAVWLAPDEAAEFTLNEIPSNRWDVWQSCQDMGVDLAIVPAQGRVKKLLIADMDSTMIEQECIDELAEEAGVGDHVRDITARAMNGELDFDAALHARVGLLKGLPVSVIDKVLSERVTYMPGGAVLLSTMKAGGAYAALVSGGFTAFTRQVAATLGFDSHQANELLTEDGMLSGEVAMPILGQAAKVAALERLTQERDIDPMDAIAVGDGANDLGMLHRAGLGVAMHAKPAVAAQCDVRINHGDLTALLFLQGFGRDEFVNA